MDTRVGYYTRIGQDITTGCVTDFLLVWFYSLKSVYGQSLQTYDNPLLEFEFQYPSEWKRVMTEGLTGVGFSLYKLNNTEPNVYDTFGFMTIDIPETKTLKQYLRDLNLILKINSSTLKLVESKLSGFSAMNATWIERNNKVEMIYTILDKTVYILQFPHCRILESNNIFCGYISNRISLRFSRIIQV